MKQLVLVEGLPGTGKTTSAQKLFNHLYSKGEAVSVFFEGDERIPCDFYEMAGIPVKEFDTFHACHSKIAEELWAISMRTANYVYLRLDKCSDFVADNFRKWDMGDEHNQQINIQHYISCALERLDYWVSLNIDNDNTVIMDSGFLQNPVNELLFRKASNDEVRSYIRNISEKLVPLNPLCLYLKRENAQIAISFARQAKGPGWSSRIDAMLEELGCPNLFEQRFELELSLLSYIPHIICSVQGNDWSDFDEQVKRVF